MAASYGQSRCRRTQPPPPPPRPPLPARAVDRGPRGSSPCFSSSAPAAARSRSHETARAHPNTPVFPARLPGRTRSRHAPGPVSSSAWATDLADIFGWDDVLAASGVGAGDGDSSNQTRVLPPKRIALDGANIAWSLGTSVRSRLQHHRLGAERGRDTRAALRAGERRSTTSWRSCPRSTLWGLQTLWRRRRAAVRLNADVRRYIGAERSLGEHAPDGSRR